MKSSSPAASDRTLASTSDMNSEANVVSTSDDDKPRSSAHISEPGLSTSTSAAQLNIITSTSSADSSKSRKRRLEDDAVAPDTVPPSSRDGPESGGSLLRSSLDRHGDRAKNTSLETKIETGAGMDYPAKKRRTEGQSENILDQEAGLSNAAGPQNLPNFVITGTDEQATTPSRSKAAALETEECVPKPVTPQRTKRSDSSDLDAPTPSKKPRFDASFVTTSAPKGPPFLTLPLELLSEILILTGSPQHVLAVARSCKALCQTLLSPDAQFIWREARKGPGCSFKTKTHATQPTPIVNVNVNPGLQMALLGLGLAEPSADEVSTNVTRLPDPPPRFFSSEAAYAAFIFDSGTCDCCNKETNMMYCSFALKSRVCKSAKCSLPEGLVTLSPRDPLYQFLKLTLPENEAQGFNNNYFSHVPYHRQGHYVRQDALDAARKEYSSDPTYQKKYEKLKIRKQEWMKLCKALSQWKEVRQEQYRENKAKNENLGKQLANKYGWQYDDLMNSTLYGPYQRRKSKLIERLDEEDVKVMRETIEESLLVTSERRGRRNAEISLMDNRAGVESLYKRLRTDGKYPYLPSLSAFRDLPVISMIQTTERTKVTSSVADVLQTNPVMADLLKTQLTKWTEKAKQDLGAVLGFPKNWKNASKNVLHPVERVTGRFVCTRCKRVDVKYRSDGCLDFAGACRHECGVGNEKKGRIRKGKKGKWDSAIFAKDEKAIKALRKCLELSKHAEDRDGGNYLLKVGFGVVCNSCDQPMVIDSRNIIGHCHRHDEMSLSFESIEKLTSFLGGYPYEYGLVQKLLGPTSTSADAKKEIERKNFGCRHCLREKMETEAAAASAVATASTNQPSDVHPQGPTPPTTKAGAKPTMIELKALVYHMHDTTEGPLEKPPPLYNFNGMRSHLKGKHGIEDIRDEDIFCYRSTSI